MGFEPTTFCMASLIRKRAKSRRIPVLEREARTSSASAGV
jgi:hypothetical protein